MYGFLERVHSDQGANVDYNKYIKKLRNDLKEELMIAQENVDVIQQHQSELYNRRMKDGHIELGDQVLQANKDERGKRKLADRWETTLYRVAALNPQCHIFRVRNTKKGQEKRVHRNLLVQANFLPLKELQSLEDDGGTVLSSGNVSMDGVVVPLADLCSLPERVASWE